MSPEHERNETCKKEFDSLHEIINRHVEQSIPFRETQIQHNEQILTLNKAHAQNMESIKEIQINISLIKESITGLKVWILTSAVAGLITLLGVAMYYGGDKRQIEVNTHRLDRVESIIDSRPIDKPPIKSIN